MAENIYENLPMDGPEHGLSESVVILENLEDAEDAELNKGMAHLTIVASPTLQLKDENNKVFDIQYEHVEEIRSTQNKNLLQLTSRDQTFFIKFNTRESMTHWLGVFKTTLHVSGISRHRPSTERHVRDKKLAEAYRKRFSTQFAKQEYHRADHRDRTQDDPIYDDTATDDKSCRKTTPHGQNSGSYIIINEMHGDFIYKEEPSFKHSNSKAPSSNHYQSLCRTESPPTCDFEFQQKPTSFDSAFDGLRSRGPKEGLFNMCVFKSDEIHKLSSQTVPSAVVCRYSKLVAEHRQNSGKGTGSLLKKKINRDECLERKFTSFESNVFVSSTPADDKYMYVGDRIQAVRGIEVRGDALFAERLIQESKSKMVEITLSRLPRAEIGLVRRSFNDQPIGITFKGTKISRVDKGSAFAAIFGHGTHRSVTHINGTYFAPGTNETETRQRT